MSTKPPEAPESTDDSPRVPRLNTIYFYLTGGCNLACRHCWIAPQYMGDGAPGPVLDFDLFRSIIAQAKPLGLSGVKLTGGEPLMHPDIRAFIEHVRAEGLRLTVETNGVLCTKGLAEQMAAGSGAFVSVSLDGADAETHEWVRGVEGAFEAALTGIRTLAEAGLRPQIIMSVMRRNVVQMEPLVRLAESLGAGSVKFNLVQPTARGEKLHTAGETLTIGELIDRSRWVEQELRPATSLRLFYDHPMAFRPLGRLFGERGDGCSVCGILGILGVLANGSYALCGIGTSLPEMVFGEAEKDRLEDVWKTTPILTQLRQGLPHRLTGICGECIMRAGCIGSCIAQNYYRDGSLWAPFWYCQLADEAGLFPASRRGKSAPVTVEEPAPREALT